MTPAEPRPAAAVLLTAGGRVLLVRRSPELRAFPGLWAFPGGKVALTDHEVPVDGAAEPAEAARIAAAAREVFEETGVFLARTREPLGEKARRDLRASLLAGRASFTDVLDAAGARLAASDLRPVASRETPAWAPFRFATRFFRAALPPRQAPEVWPGEVVESALLRPEDALEQWVHGRLPLAPPVIGLLKRWSEDDREYRGRNAEAARAEPGVLPAISAFPGIDVVACRTPTLPPATHTNAVLVGNSSSYLVDPAAVDPAERAGLFARVDRLLGERRGRLAGVLATHHHDDHTGSVAAAAAHYQVPVGAHPETLARMDPGPGPVLRLRGGEALPLGSAPDGSADWRLEARFTPGHAPGHLVFCDSRYGVVVAGDMVSSLSSVLIPPDDGDLGLYMDSLRRLATACRGPVIPAHGPPVVEGRRLLEQQIRHRESREAKLLRVLVGEPRTSEQIGADVYPAEEVPASGPVRELALASLQSGLRKLEQEGRAARRNGGWFGPAAR